MIWVILWEKIYFEDDGTQNYLVFQPIYKYFSANNSNILSLKSKGLSNASIKRSNTSNRILHPTLYFVGTKIRAKFNGGYLKQEKITYHHGKIVNVYIVYEMKRSINVSSYPTLENCLVQSN